MAFTFVHTADWQLGKPFASFAPELAGRLREARLEAIARIGDAARVHGARHVVVAGDVFDQEAPSEATIRQALDVLYRDQSLTWWLLPGNHDPVRRNGLWTRIAAARPANVRLLLEAAPVEAEPGVFLLPAPWTSKDPGHDLTEAFCEMVTPEGAQRIGLAHGGIREFREDAAQSNTIAEGRARMAGLAYLALGDWHGRAEVDERTWYAGTPEPDRFPRNEPGWCLAVTLDDPSSNPGVEAVSTAAFRWIRDEISLIPGDAMGSRLEERFAGPVPFHKILARLDLSGRLRLPERNALIEELDNWRGRLAHLECRAERLLTVIEAGDLDELDRAGSLRMAADRLAAIAVDPAAADGRRADAVHALDLLVSFAGSGGSQTP